MLHLIQICSCTDLLQAITPRHVVGRARSWAQMEARREKNVMVAPPPRLQLAIEDAEHKSNDAGINQNHAGSYLGEFSRFSTGKTKE